MIAQPVGAMDKVPTIFRLSFAIRICEFSFFFFNKIETRYFKFDPTFDWSELDDLMHNGVSSTRFRPIESSLAEKYLSSEEFSPERKVGNIIISNQNKLLRKLIGRCFLYLLLLPFYSSPFNHCNI